MHLINRIILILRIAFFRIAGAIAKSDHFEIHRTFSGRGVIVAKKIEYRRSSDDGMVRSSAHLDAP